jgi:histidinol-phosphate phosphatase family protein
MATIKALLLAAGLGTRLHPLTLTVPKCLVPISGRSLLDYWAESLVSGGVRSALINTHHLAGAVRLAIDDIRSRWNFRLEESHEPVLLGSAGTIAANPDFANESDVIVIVYADNLSDIHLADVLAFHRSHSVGFSMVLFRAADPAACGIASLDENGIVANFIEKPRAPESNLANAGIYVIDGSVYKEIAALRAFDVARDVIPRFLGRMKGFVFDGYHRDIGTHESLAAARREVAAGLFRQAASQASLRERALRKAVFFDRDGTLIEPVHYLDDAGKVRLLPDVGEALRAVGEMGFLRIVVTNQAAIARNLLTVPELVSIQAELQRQLKEHGASVDAWYFSPHAGTSSDRERIDHFDRKPGPGMLLRAAQEHGIDLTRSVMVGDMVSDTLAGRNAGCAATVLLGRNGESFAHHPSVDFRLDGFRGFPVLLKEIEGRFSTGVGRPVRIGDCSAL